MVCELFISIKQYQKTSKNALLQTSELYNWCIYSFLEECRPYVPVSIVVASIRKRVPKEWPTVPFWQRGEVKSHLGNAHIHRPLYQKRASLTFDKSEQDKMLSQLVKQISIFICLQQTKHICATRILLSSLHHNRLAVFLPAMVQNQSGCFARV